MPIFSIDIQVAATAYIRADSEEEALAIAKGMVGSGLYTDGSDDDGIQFDGRKFDDPELPDVSVSPAMTIHGLFGEEMECVDDDEEDEEEEECPQESPAS